MAPPGVADVARNPSERELRCLLLPALPRPMLTQRVAARCAASCATTKTTRGTTRYAAAWRLPCARDAMHGGDAVCVADEGRLQVRELPAQQEDGASGKFPRAGCARRVGMQSADGVDGLGRAWARRGRGRGRRARRQPR
eukprot:306655-Rhodomonas_salina.1